MLVHRMYVRFESIWLKALVFMLFNSVLVAAPLLVRAQAVVIPNQSVEDVADTGLPVGWATSSYGFNDPFFEYVDGDGHEGRRSLKVTMRDRVSGDAKWQFSPQPVETGADYVFSGWYKSNITPSVVAEYTHEDGRVTHFGMPQAEISSDEWRQYKQVFSTPPDAVAATIYFFIKEDGWLQTDDYVIEPFTYEGFDRPIVTLTFDDGAKRNVETVLPLLNRLGFKSTHCYMTRPVEGNRKVAGYVKEFFAHGNEICSHSISHPDLTTLTSEELDRELTHSRAYLERVTDAPVLSIATPFGAYDEKVIAEIKKYYNLHRSVDVGYNAVNSFDPYNLKVQNMLEETSLEEFQGWVNKAIEENLWLILVYHRVDDENIKAYDTYDADFEAQMEWLATVDVSVMRLDDAFAEVLPQTQVVHDPVLEDVTEEGILPFLVSIWKQVRYFLAHP